MTRNLYYVPLRLNFNIPRFLLFYLVWAKKMLSTLTRAFHEYIKILKQQMEMR